MSTVPIRIASVLPSATELIAELGFIESLVAVSHECDWPSGVAELPHVTSAAMPHGLSPAEIDRWITDRLAAGQSLYSVDAQQLTALQPDLIVTQGICDVCAVTPDHIEVSLRGQQCQLPSSTQILSLGGTSFAGVCEDVERLASALETSAAELLSDARRRWASIAAPSKRPRVLLLEWVEPAFSAGHWVPEQLHAAGCESAIGGPGEHSRRLSKAEILAADPDFIGVICCGFGLAENLSHASWLFEDAELSELSAVREGKVWCFDANSYFSRPTLRIVDGAHLLHQAFVQQAESPSYKRLAAATPSSHESGS